jgi:hypothetical protein
MNWDLTSLAYSEVGTLSEIGAQAGDTVEVNDTDTRYKIHSVYGNVYKYGSLRHQILSPDANGCKWRMVSRASDKPTSPVRTVIKTEIVTGTYGRIKVVSNGLEAVHINVFDGSRVWSVEDFTDAITTLTKIRDAMKGS